MLEVSKADWKLYREKIGGWQEAYMEKLLREYIAVLQGPETASAKFWTLEKRIKEDKHNPGVIVEMSKRNMIFDLLHLLHIGAVTLEDLKDFSQELQDTVRDMDKRYS